MYASAPCVHSALGGQKRVLDSLELSDSWLWAAMWMLETKLSRHISKVPLKAELPSQTPHPILFNLEKGKLGTGLMSVVSALARHRWEDCP